MSKIEEIYMQIKNIDFVKNKMGNEQWVQVSGNKKMNDADALFWAYLIPLNRIDESLSNYGWESSIGTQAPCFSGNKEDARYDRLSFKGDEYENIVNWREFYDVKPDYVEFVEEFRLLNNLYHDTSKNQFLQIQENGESIVVAKIENGIDAFIMLRYLLKYATARQMALCLCFDIRTKISDNIPDDGLKEIDESYCDKTICYTLSGNFDTYRKIATSILHGEKILRPKNIDQCGYYPYDKERNFADYIIGINEFGEDKLYTSDPNKLSNYFVNKSDAPQYLTPVFFKKEVLLKYYNNCNLYEVKDGRIICKSLWSMPIDNNNEDYVSAYLGDLGKYLPEEEQKHWQQYNYYSSNSPSSVAISRDFCNIFTEPIMNDLKFKEKFEFFSAKWEQEFGWKLFINLSEEDEYNYKSLHTPLTDDQNEFDMNILCLVKNIIDSLNEKELSSQLQSTSDVKGGISIFEEWLKMKNIEGYESHIKFLRNLQELRSSSVAHRKGKSYEKIKKVFGLNDDSNKKEVFEKILESVNNMLDFLLNSFSI